MTINFKLDGIPLSEYLITFIATLIGIIIVSLFILSKFHFFKMWKESGLKIFCLHPYLGRQYSIIACQNQLDKATKGKNYSPPELSEAEINKRFKEFIMDLPTYCIDDNIFSGIIRGLMTRGGAKYQQVVLHDSSSVDDTYLRIRKHGDYFVHNEGLYLFPWDNPKTVLHWDINDCRPLYDKSKDAQWNNPRMTSRYFYGVVNSKSMKPKETSGIGSSTLVLIGLLLIVAGIIVLWYYTGQYHNSEMNILTNISELQRGN